MSKSILVVDTPEACIDCPCHFAGESGMVMCGVEQQELLTDDIETFKPDWCLHLIFIIKNHKKIILDFLLQL